MTEAAYRRKRVFFLFVFFVLFCFGLQFQMARVYDVEAELAGGVGTAV